MTKTASRSFLAALGVGLFVAQAAAAQDTAQITAALDAVRSRNRVLVSGSFPLTDAESDAFWPEYDRYEKQVRDLDARTASLLSALVTSGGSLPAPRADALVDEFISIQQDRVSALREHVKRLRKAVPSGKLARYVQLDNRLELALRAELAQQLPLVQ